MILKKTRPTIGLFAGDIDDEYSATVGRGVAEEAERCDANLIVFPGNSPKAPFEFQYQRNIVYELATARNLDALIITGGAMVNFIDADEFSRFLTKYADIPKVTLAVRVDGASFVHVGDNDGLAEAITHLIRDHGRRKIAFIRGPENNQEAETRFAVFRETLRRLGIEPDPALMVPGQFTAWSAERAVTTLLGGGRQFDALVASNDEMAIAALDLLTTRGFAVPDDVAVIGYDDIEGARFATPPLATVRQPIYDEGCAAVRLAIDAIRNGSRENPSGDVALASRFIPRVSCGCSDGSTSGTQPATERVATLQRELHELIAHRRRREKTVRQLRNILTHLVTHVGSIAESCPAIEPLLRSIGVQCCAVYLYERPFAHRIDEPWRVPGSVTAAMSFGSCGRMRTHGNGPISTHDILARSTLPRDHRFTAMIAPLYHMDDQLGFLVSEIAVADAPVFQSLTVELSCALRFDELFRKQVEVEQQLRAAVTTLRSHNEQLGSIAQTDELTSLLNRRGFLSLAGEALRDARERDTGAMLLYFDLDNLKRINDSYGHDTGDEALRTFGRAVAHTFRKSDLAARIGGDEFVVFAPGMTSKMAGQLRQRLEKRLRRSALNRPYRVTFCAGSVTIDNGDEPIEALISRADDAQYDEKSRKKIDSSR